MLGMGSVLCHYISTIIEIYWTVNLGLCRQPCIDRATQAMATHALIVRTHNSARSVLSEGMLNHLLALLLETMDRAALQAALVEIGRS